jgi:hypothetical protein
MNRQVGGMLAAASLTMALVGISESVSAKKPQPPSPSTPSFYFVDSSNPPKVIGKALSLINQFGTVGLASVPVVAPSGHKATILLTVAGRQFNPYVGNTAVYFESQDCSGTPYIYYPSYNFDLAGVGPVYSIVQSPIPNPNASLLFVATQTAPQQIDSQSSAQEIGLGLAGYELSCSTYTQQQLLVLPAEFYGNLFDRYVPPYGVVMP